MAHREQHRTSRIGWLRATIMGANDGIVSTGSLVLGVAASGAAAEAVMVSGIAGLVAGAMSMAAGEYVSVSSQSDTEAADRAREAGELASDAAREMDELAGIYERRGLDAALAREVAEQLTAKDALAAHLRDELGHTPEGRARPVQAALASAAAFSAGAVVPLIFVATLPQRWTAVGVAAASLASLGLLGALAARISGTSATRPTLRVTFWGALALSITAAVGALFGVST